MRGSGLLTQVPMVALTMGKAALLLHTPSRSKWDSLRLPT